MLSCVTSNKPAPSLVSVAILIYVILLNFNGIPVTAKCVKPHPFKSIPETSLPGYPVGYVSTSPRLKWTFDFHANNCRFYELKSYFKFQSYRDEKFLNLVLSKSLDLEKLYAKGLWFRDTPIMTLYCSGSMYDGSVERIHEFNQEIYIMEVNEHFPKFNVSKIEVTLKEDTDLRRDVVRLRGWASDLDVSVRGYKDDIRVFFFSDKSGTANPYLRMANYRMGTVRLKKHLDYDTLPKNKKTLETTVAVVDKQNHITKAPLIITVTDVADEPPIFLHKDCNFTHCDVEYTAHVSKNFTGEIFFMRPTQIKAIDGEPSVRSPVVYYFTNEDVGFGDFNMYLTLDKFSGKVTVRHPFKEYEKNMFKVHVVAMEILPPHMKRSALVVLLIGGETESASEMSRYQSGFSMPVMRIILAIATLLVCLALTYLCFRKRKQPEAKLEVKE